METSPAERLDQKIKRLEANTFMKGVVRILFNTLIAIITFLCLVGIIAWKWLLWPLGILYFVSFLGLLGEIFIRGLDPFLRGTSSADEQQEDED